MTDVSSYGPSAIVTPANGVTVIRLLFAPVVFWMMYNDADSSSWPIAIFWFLLCSSDYLDGTLARKQGPTRSGAFLDPLADKVLVLGGIGVLVLAERWHIIVWLLIAGRELVISVFRSIYVRRGLAVPATRLAKWKAFLQLSAVGWVTLPWTVDINWIADIWLWAGIMAGLLSGIGYLLAGSRSATTMSN